MNFSSKLQDLKERFVRPKAGAGAGTGASAAGSPVFLMLGSLTDCAYKDALAFARGLAESYVVSPPMGRVRVVEDKAANRFIYEIREGGPEFSVIEGVQAALLAGEAVRIKLAGGGVAVIEEPHGEIFTLVHPPKSADDKASILNGTAPVEDDFPIEHYCGSIKMDELFPERKQLIGAGAIALSVSVIVFMLTGAYYTLLQSGVFDADALMSLTKKGHLAPADDNPVWQLDKARAAADKEGRPVHVLKKVSGAWSWELTKESK